MSSNMNSSSLFSSRSVAATLAVSVGLMTSLLAGCATKEPTAPSSTPEVTPPRSMPMDRPATSKPAASTAATVTPSTVTPSTVTSSTAESAILPNRDTADHAAAAQQPADNSGRNLSEDGREVTPLDQGNSSTDMTITSTIRASLSDRHDLSINAKNIKIITREGVVTLRGVVADQRERDIVLKIAGTAADAQRVDDHLDMTSK